MRAVAALVAVAALAVPVAAWAVRAPTLTERAAITRALPGPIRKVPAGCVWFDIRMSSKAGWASVTPRWLVGPSGSDPCLRYAADGKYLLRRAKGTWRVVFDGSDLPPCTLRAPRDLGACSS